VEKYSHNLVAMFFYNVAKLDIGAIFAFKFLLCETASLDYLNWCDKTCILERPGKD